MKTRVGFNKVELETWLPEILAEEPAVITIHARTRKEMSKVPARWGACKRAVEIRNELKSNTLIFGNGDVMNIEDARVKATETGADGIMLGRAFLVIHGFFRKRSKNNHNSRKAYSTRRTLRTFDELLGGVKKFCHYEEAF